MTGYNRALGISWPVVFRVDNGHRFTVSPPVRGPQGPVLRCHVEGGAGAGDYEVGEYLGEQTAGGIIGRTIRWWVEQTGIGVTIDPRRSE